MESRRKFIRKLRVSCFIMGALAFTWGFATAKAFGDPQTQQGYIYRNCMFQMAAGNQSSDIGSGTVSYNPATGQEMWIRNDGFIIAAISRKFMHSLTVSGYPCVSSPDLTRLECLITNGPKVMVEHYADAQVSQYGTVYRTICATASGEAQ